MRTFNAMAIHRCRDACGVAGASRETLLSRQGGIHVMNPAQRPTVGAANDADTCSQSKAR